MSQFSKFLKTSSSAPVQETERPDRLGVKLKPAVSAHKNKRQSQIAFDAKLPGRVETGGAGKNVLMPQKDATDYTKTQALLRILSDTSTDLTKSSGSDPYNSGTK